MTGIQRIGNKTPSQIAKEIMPSNGEFRGNIIEQYGLGSIDFSKLQDPNIFSVARLIEAELKKSGK